MYVVKDNTLDCYGWGIGDRLMILEDVSSKHALGVKVYKVFNIDKNDGGVVERSQMLYIPEHVYDDAMMYVH